MSENSVNEKEIYVAAERDARSQAPEQSVVPRVVAWGPSCEDEGERPAHRIGVRS